jgi:multicomponent Na+:H+ antiporter subunit C
MQILSTHFPYIAAFILLGLGAYLLITTQNNVKKLYGLAIFQSAVLLFAISLGYIDGGFAPIFEAGVVRPMVNPLPQVLMLTAIVVGIATLAVGLALAIRIRKTEG